MKRLLSHNIKPLQISASAHSEQEELSSPDGKTNQFFPSSYSTPNETMTDSYTTNPENNNSSSSSSKPYLTHESSNQSAHLNLPQDIMIPSWDDIEILGLIGSGSTSVVHLARIRSNDSLIALKLIPLYRDKKTKEMLLDEINTLLRTDCDALVSFYGITYREGQVSKKNNNHPRKK